MLSKTAPAVRLEAVSYRYPQSDKVALSEISYTFLTGTTAIVGPNGAGKSTLVKLLTGLLAPTAGSIRVELPGGTSPAPDQAPKGALFQEPSHLYLTIRQNVTMRFERTATEDARIYDALEIAGLSGLVMRLPDGIDTLVGAGFGGRLDLSGGQWQRLALARLIYQDAPVMILDEPVASLDPEGERAVFELFAEQNGAKIIVFTTHRYDSIPRGTKIVVLVDGRVAEIGTHEELLERQRDYWSLYVTDGPTGRREHGGVAPRRRGVRYVVVPSRDRAAGEEKCDAGGNDLKSVLGTRAFVTRVVEEVRQASEVGERPAAEVKGHGRMSESAEVCGAQEGGRPQNGQAADGQDDSAARLAPHHPRAGRNVG